MLPVALVVFLIFITLLGVLVYLYMRSATILLLLAIISGFLVVLLPAPPELAKNRTVGVIFGLTIGFGMAFGFGIDWARYELWSQLPLNKITIGEKGKDTETDVTARIIRSGERGVLYYDPKVGQFGLVPWDSIKRIDWARSPLIGETL